MYKYRVYVTALFLFGSCWMGVPTFAYAQNTTPEPVAADESTASLAQQLSDLRIVILKLQSRVDELEKKEAGNAPAVSSPGPGSASQTQIVASAATQKNDPQEAAAPQSSSSSISVPRPSQPGVNAVPPGTTINGFVDAYYGYNFNNPIGGVNLLRTYDVSSNSFSISQAGVVVENAPDPDNGKRFGMRLDLQWGQATQALQSNPASEPRPSLYRNIFQAYGTYVLPVGKGLTVDFGKFASSIGPEGNYTKDQTNYSRSYWFNFLPYYHMGFRSSYKVNDLLTINYWLVNGVQQTEDFNGFKDQLAGVVVTPNKKISWTAQYYFGQEHPNVTYFLQGGAPPNAPALQGVPFEPIANAPTGKLHILDTYLTWQLTPKWFVEIEADDVIQRLYTNSYPAHTAGGAAYLKYQITDKLYAAARTEYLTDRGGLFSGRTQALKEGTVTLAYRLDQGFEFMTEWRRDFSNQPYFYTDTLVLLRRDQTTATLGLLWWFGGKQGSW